MHMHAHTHTHIYTHISTLMLSTYITLVPNEDNVPNVYTVPNAQSTQCT